MQAWKPNNFNFNSRKGKTPQKELVLKYIQDNPAKCAHAKYMDLTRQIIAAYPDEDLSESSISSVLSQLSTKRILLTQKGYGSKSWNINYAHKLLPQSIRDGGTEEEQTLRERLLENLKPGQTLEKDGTITTKDESVIAHSDDPFDEEPQEDNNQQGDEDVPQLLADDELQEICDEAVQPLEETTAEPVEEPQPVEAVIEHKDGAIKLSLTINININGAK